MPARPLIDDYTRAPESPLAFNFDTHPIITPSMEAWLLRLAKNQPLLRPPREGVEKKMFYDFVNGKIDERNPIIVGGVRERNILDRKLGDYRIPGTDRAVYDFLSEGSKDGSAVDQTSPYSARGYLANQSLRSIGRNVKNYWGDAYNTYVAPKAKQFADTAGNWLKQKAKSYGSDLAVVGDDLKSRAKSLYGNMRGTLRDALNDLSRASDNIQTAAASKKPDTSGNSSPDRR